MPMVSTNGPQKDPTHALQTHWPPLPGFAQHFAAAAARSSGRLTFISGPYVHHFNYDPTTSMNLLTGLEWEPRGFRLEYVRLISGIHSITQGYA